MSPSYFEGPSDDNSGISINRIYIKWEVDSSPDLSYLQTTADSHYGKEGSNWDHLPDEAKARVLAEFGSIYAACEAYARQDAERLSEFGHSWEMLGCTAYAEVRYPIGGKDWRLETLSSGGLCGIESDSDSAYMDEVQAEQLAELKLHLEKFGVNVAEFDEMTKKAEVRGR